MVSSYAQSFKGGAFDLKGFMEKLIRQTAFKLYHKPYQAIEGDKVYIAYSDGSIWCFSDREDKGSFRHMEELQAPQFNGHIWPKEEFPNGQRVSTYGSIFTDTLEAAKNFVALMLESQKGV